jgi:hypothetical protein
LRFEGERIAMRAWSAARSACVPWQLEARKALHASRQRAMTMTSSAPRVAAEGAEPLNYNAYKITLLSRTSCAARSAEA